MPPTRCSASCANSSAKLVCRCRRWSSAPVSWRTSPWIGVGTRQAAARSRMPEEEERKMATAERLPTGAPGTPDVTGQLHRRALGTRDLVFFIVAASAPLTAVAGGQAASYLVTGNKGIPFLFIPLAIILGIFTVGSAAMSRHVADAGAFYTYVTRGLGRIPGVVTAFVAVVSYNSMPFGIYGLFGAATGGFMADKLGITLDWYWWCLFAGAIIALLGVLQVDLNARVLAVFLTLEIIVVALFDLAILADPGPQGLTGI